MVIFHSYVSLPEGKNYGDSMAGWWFGTMEFWMTFQKQLGMENHPNWRTHVFQRGRYTTNQMGCNGKRNMWKKQSLIWQLDILENTLWSHKHICQFWLGLKIYQTKHIPQMWLPQLMVTIRPNIGSGAGGRRGSNDSREVKGFGRILWTWYGCNLRSSQGRRAQRFWKMNG